MKEGLGCNVRGRPEQNASERVEGGACLDVVGGRGGSRVSAFGDGSDYITNEEGLHLKQGE